MELDDFLSWLFGRYSNSFTESQVLEKLTLYENAITPLAVNGIYDFSFTDLKEKIEQKWLQNRIPAPVELQGFIKEINRYNKPCEALIQARESHKYFEEHKEECLAAMNKVMDKVEQLWGKRPGKERKCF